MNSTAIESQIQALLQSGARAVLVAPNHGGQGLCTQAIVQGQSVVNLSTELKDHLDSYPFTTEWLTDLRDYLDQRLATRSDAARTGGVAMPGPRGHYVLHMHIRNLEGA